MRSKVCLTFEYRMYYYSSAACSKLSFNQHEKVLIISEPI